MTHQPEQKKQQLPITAKVQQSPLNDPKASKPEVEILSDEELERIVGGAGDSTPLSNSSGQCGIGGGGGRSGGVVGG